MTELPAGLRRFRARLETAAADDLCAVESEARNERGQPQIEATPFVPTKRRGATLGAGRVWRLRLLLHHVPIAAGSAGMLVLLMGVPPFVVRERSIFTGAFSSSLLARTTGDVATVLLALTLLIGPTNLLLRRRNPISSYLRRDVGVWAAVLSAVHVVVGFQVRGETRLFSFVSYFIADGRPLTDSFGLGNWTGLVALVLVAGLLAISTDRSVRELKAVRWKNLQRLNYTLFGLVIAHAIFYGALSQTTSPFTRFLFFTIASVFVGQAAGVWLHRRRRQRAVPATVEAAPSLTAEAH